MLISVTSLYDEYLGSQFSFVDNPFMISSLVNHCVVSRGFGTHDGNYRDAIVIYWLYTRLTCIHV